MSRLTSRFSYSPLWYIPLKHKISVGKHRNVSAVRRADSAAKRWRSESYSDVFCFC